MREKDTSWDSVGKWYCSIIGEEGHYYHQHIIIPRLIKLLDLKSHPSSKILDLGCGPGVLARHIPEKVSYVGLDVSPSFIKEARKLDPSPFHHFIVADASKPLPIKDQVFTHATIILALQNMEHPNLVFKNCSQHLEKNGRLIVVLNHPCFRIPRQSSWQVDETKKLQYRRIDRYYTPMQIPLIAHPSKGQKSETLLTFHHPLSYYTTTLKEAGFVIEELEEWCSDKQSTGKNAKMENRSRQEFPLFLTFNCVKIK